MKDKTRNKLNDERETYKDKKYDIFISYRHLSSDGENHSTSLARSIAQAFEIEGFNVFFDCKDTADNPFNIIQENESRYYIILVTEYSIKTIKECPFQYVERKENGEELEENEGYSFAKELYLIDKGLESGRIDNKNVCFFNIDKFGRRRDIVATLNGSNFRSLGKEFRSQGIEAINFPTDQDFSIDKLINGNNRKIEKHQRLNFNTCYEKFKKQRRLIPTIAFVAVVAFVALAFAISQLRQCRTDIIFAGGGTVKQYLKDSLDLKDGRGVDVDDYPNSKYIHVPSITAWSLLLDDANEGENRQYCPIVLSAARIDTSDPNFRNVKNRIIVEYEIGSIPLMIQIQFEDNWQGENDKISIEKLEEIIKDTSNHTIFSTSENSGTYLAYKRLFRFDLDSLVDNQRGGRRLFNPSKCFDEETEETRRKIFLANKSYFYDNEAFDKLIVDSDPVPLYVYTIAVPKSTETDEMVLLPKAKLFLEKIGCDCDTIIKATNKKEPFFTLLKKKDKH